MKIEEMTADELNKLEVDLAQAVTWDAWDYALIVVVAFILLFAIGDLIRYFFPTVYHEGTQEDQGEQK